MSNRGSYESVYNAIIYRIGTQHVDLLVTYGADKVLTAIEDKASQFESYELEEIGSSDVSCWVTDIKESLARS